MKLRPFELTLVIIFAVMAIAALIMIKLYKPSPDDGQVQIVKNVEIWGTIPAKGINEVIHDLSRGNENYKKVSYRHFQPEQFDLTLLRALADGNGPDLILVSHEKLVEMRQRIQPFSYDSFPIRDIRDIYLDGAQIFAMNDGLYGYPIAVDPLMMYWNRDILATEGYLEAPATWESLVSTMFTDLIQRDFDRTVHRSVVAMGEYENVRNSFGIISALFIQGGSARVVEKPNNNLYTVQLQLSENGGDDPLEAAADFYTRFSQPSNALYSWNRAFEDDRRQFISEDLAFYFGYGSEGPQLELINPNLNFDIAEIPQGASATVRRTYAKFYALSMLKSSRNKAGAAVVISDFATEELSNRIAIESDMVPARRKAVSAGSNDTYGRLTYQSAFVALGWLNPERSASDEIFKTMTEDINENRTNVAGAAGDVSQRLKSEY